MNELNEKISRNEKINLFILNDIQFASQSYEFLNTFRVLQNMIATYDEELSKVLILSRSADLKAFFKDHNTILKNMYEIFSTVKNLKVKEYVEIIITDQRKLNLKYAKQYI